MTFITQNNHETTLLEIKFLESNFVLKLNTRTNFSIDVTVKT